MRRIAVRACVLAAVGFSLALVSCVEAPSDAEPKDLVTILKVENPRERSGLLRAHLDASEPADLPDLLASLQAERLRLDNAVGVELALWWTQQDPVSAYEDGLKGRWLEGKLWAETVVREWTRLAPEEALAHVRRALVKEGGPGWGRTLMMALVRGWFDSPDPDVKPLIGFIEHLEPGRPKKEALDLLLTRMIAFGSREEAIAFVTGLPDFDEFGRSALKKDAHKRLATQLAARDPEEAARWALEQASGPYGEELLVRVGRRWARDEGQRAVEWARSVPEDSGARPRAMLEAMRGWTVTDGEASAVWIDAQPLAPELEPLLAMSVVRMANSRRPAEAMKRLDRVPGGPFKDDLVVSIGRAWLRFFPEEAEAWIEQAGFSPEVVSAMRQSRGAKHQGG
jgi:hypothetical protein